MSHYYYLDIVIQYPFNGFETPLDNCWKWQKSNQYITNNNTLSMVKVDVNSHLAMKREKIGIGDYDYNHTIRISIKDYWNDIEDYWDVNFVSKSRKTSNVNRKQVPEIFVSRYVSDIIWNWK